MFMFKNISKTFLEHVFVSYEEIDLRVGGDVETRYARFLQRVLLIQNLLIHFSHDLLIHHPLLFFHSLIESLKR